MSILWAASIIASGLSPKANCQIRAMCIQARAVTPTCTENFFESKFNFKGFNEVNRITVRAGTARGTSVIITFREKDSEATSVFAMKGNPPNKVYRY